MGSSLEWGMVGCLVPVKVCWSREDGVSGVAVWTDVDSCLCDGSGVDVV